MDQNLRDLYRRTDLDPEDPQALPALAQARARAGDDPGAYALLFQAGLAEAGHPLAREIGGRIFEGEREHLARLPGSFHALPDQRPQIGGVDASDGSDWPTDIEAVIDDRLPVASLNCPMRIHGRGAAALEALSCLFSLRIQSTPRSRSDQTALFLIHRSKRGQPSLLSKLRSLRSFAWSHRQISRGAIEALEELEYLHSLNLSLAQVNDRDALALKRLDRLESLNLSYSPFSDTGLEQLTTLTQLRSLNLHETRVRGRGLTALSLMPRLRELNLWHCSLDEGALTPIGALPELEKLILIEAEVDSLKPLAASPSLAELHISRTSIGDEGLKALEGVRTLTSLFAAETQIRGPGLAALVEGNSLTKLCLDGCELSPEAFSHITRMPKLEYLALQKARYDPAGLAVLEKAAALKTLSLALGPDGSLEAGRRLKATRPDIKIR